MYIYTIFRLLKALSSEKMKLLLNKKIKMAAFAPCTSNMDGGAIMGDKCIIIK
jgi:hypothetical protein